MKKELCVNNGCEVILSLPFDSFDKKNKNKMQQTKNIP